MDTGNASGTTSASTPSATAPAPVANESEEQYPPFDLSAFVPPPPRVPSYFLKTPRLPPRDPDAIVDPANYDPRNPPPPPLLSQYKGQPDDAVGYGPPPGFSFKGNCLVRDEPEEGAAAIGLASFGAEEGPRDVSMDSSVGGGVGAGDGTAVEMLGDAGTEGEDLSTMAGGAESEGATPNLPSSSSAQRIAESDDDDEDGYPPFDLSACVPPPPRIPSYFLKVPRLPSRDPTAIVDTTGYDPHNPLPPPPLSRYKGQPDDAVGFGPPPGFSFRGNCLVRDEVLGGSSSVDVENRSQWASKGVSGGGELFAGGDAFVGSMGGGKTEGEACSPLASGSESRAATNEDSPTTSAHPSFDPPSSLSQSRHAPTSGPPIKRIRLNSSPFASNSAGPSKDPSAFVAREATHAELANLSLSEEKRE
ncbi:hypothetical protein BCR35DRAFT_309211 [Leucosporidium creatinivorum]|uniref:Uncharacterized protein n=1 Tax=Leucosporidium creatinivorum TaxID=106004 RepID=A0A1Y2DKX1_9BASI|nr:hypothetical protein BCR35DRAFT_309211 [Leucosporidium creatinivorum]